MRLIAGSDSNKNKQKLNILWKSPPQTKQKLYTLENTNTIRTVEPVNMKNKK
jgi:hypothetical protein